MSDLERVLAKVEVGECWLWTAWRDPNGYGRVRFAGRILYAHRVVWRLLVGEIPEGLELDHLCRVKACVNPEHLEPVTHAENMRRANGRTVCRRGHRLTTRSDGRRRCRPCDLARKRALRRGDPWPP